jgi:hypothetical protein
MTDRYRQPRVADVVAIIGRKTARIADIEEAIETLNFTRLSGPPLKKHDKKAARALAATLYRAERILACRDMQTLLDFFEYEEWLVDLKRFRKGLEEIADLKLGQPKPSTARSDLQREAAAAAAQLLEKHGLRPTATRKTSKQQVSVFCRLAAVLYGDPRADLYHHCRTHIKKTRNQGSK